MFRIWLQRIFIVVLFMGAIFYAYQTFRSTDQLGAIGDPTIDNWEKRFVALKEQLPVKNGIIGYLADFDIPGVQSNISDQEAEYILAQYTMAPVVLERGTNREWILGNLTPSAFKIWEGTATGKYEVTGFGKNLYLIHKVGQ